MSTDVRSGRAATVLVAFCILSALVAWVMPGRAFGDYGPSSQDVVGVGDSLSQFGLDFVADGDAYMDPGYNSNGNRNKLVSVDSVSDANGRTVFGDGGVATATCSPGTGAQVATGNLSSRYGAKVFPWSSPSGSLACVLNPTVVLRAGALAVQRPTGSASGLAALEADVTAGHNVPKTEVIDFARSSVPLSPSAQSHYGLEGVQIATDSMAVLTAPTSHAVPLSANELSNIFDANATGTNAYGGAGCVTWNELPGNSSGSSDQIIPILPPAASDTSSAFLQQIQATTGAPAIAGSCVVTAQNNDLLAIQEQIQPADAIEPSTAGWVDMMEGLNSTGQTQGVPSYFLDPSCPYLPAGVTTCGTGGDTYSETTVASGSNGVNINTFTGSGTLSVASTTGFASSGTLQVATSNGQAVLNYTATAATSFTGVSVANSSSGGAQSGVLATNNIVSQSTDTWSTYTLSGLRGLQFVTTGTPGDGHALFDPAVPIYVYFRAADQYTTNPFQPGGSVNWVNTLFYDPCLSGQSGCITVGAYTYGPAGPPWVVQAGGQQVISDAGLTPLVGN